MEDLFRSYWWLLFPLGWFVVSGWTSFLNYRRQQRTLELIKTYAEKGQEPPEALLKVLGRPIDSDNEWWNDRTESGTSRPPQARNYWSLFGLFGMLGAGFGAAAWIYQSEGMGLPFGIVALTMGAVALWALVNAAFLSRKG